MKRTITTLFALLVAGAACGDSTSGSQGGTGATGGSGGSGATGGTGGSGGGATTCNDIELPGALADGSWSDAYTVAGLAGQDGLSPKVLDLALDPDGALVAAGYFSWSDGQPVPPLARMSEGRWTPGREEWNLDLPAAGFAAVAYGDGLTALATHSTLTPHEVEIWIDDGSGFEVIGHAEGRVRELLFHGDHLWVAGHFTLDEGGFAGLALWDGAAWSSPPGGAADGPVYELLVEGESLYVGGGFENIGGTAASQIASFDGSSWTAHDFDLGPGTVYALSIGTGGEIFAGGMLFRDPEEGRGGIARWDGTQWELLGDGVASGFIPGVINDMVRFDGDLYVTGCFTHVGGAASSETAIQGRHIARWTEAGWEAVDDDSAGVLSAWFAPAACGDEGFFAVWEMGVQKLLATEDRLYVAGSFPGIGGVASQSVIAYDGERFLPVGEGGDGFSGTVADMAVGGDGCSVYALGGFTHAGGTAVPAGLVRRGSTGWEPIGAGRPAGLDCNELEVSEDGAIYVGCTAWGDDDTDPRARVFAIEADEWKPLGEPHDLWTLLDMTLDAEGRPWIAGSGPVNYVARLGDEGFEIVEDGFDAAVSGIELSPPDDEGTQQLVAAGYFTSIDGMPFNRIAHWDGATWSALGDGLAAGPTALAYGSTGIYASTNFEGDPARQILARWDGEGWTELATPANGIAAPIGESVHTFTNLVERDGMLVATGYVWPEEGGRNAFVWDGTRFEAIGGGIAAISVDAVAITEAGIFFGGWIAEAGPAGERASSVGVAQLERQ
ncbi:hypothetical protein [Vulgatibacter sp.]|uniref:hypothetical protein n=1 Tax=Vulgatibacter sp. TaxID=1971226 RepID=UPI00356363E9